MNPQTQTPSAHLHLTFKNKLNKDLVGVVAGILLVLAVYVGLHQRFPARNLAGNPASAQRCEQPEVCIQEAVFRYEILNSEGHELSSLYFLSDQGHDPDNEIVKRLTTESFRVKPLSESIQQHSVITDKGTGEPGVVLRVGKITWVDRTRARLGVSAVSGWNDVKEYVYHLTLSANGWTVTDREWVLES